MTLVSLSQDWNQVYKSGELYSFMENVTDNEIIDVIKIMYIDNNIHNEPLFGFGQSFKQFLKMKSQKSIDNFVECNEIN